MSLRYGDNKDKKHEMRQAISVGRNNLEDLGVDG